MNLKLTIIQSKCYLHYSAKGIILSQIELKQSKLLTFRVNLCNKGHALIREVYGRRSNGAATANSKYFRSLNCGKLWGKFGC